MISSKSPFVFALVAALFGASASSYGQTYRAELYTMGSGDELFTKFGHAALCVTVPDRPPTLCFNYGTTDFSRPVGLTMDVLRGRAEFFVSVVEEGDMLASFELDDRTIFRQALPLSEEQVLRQRKNFSMMPGRRIAHTFTTISSTTAPLNPGTSLTTSLVVCCAPRPSGVIPRPIANWSTKDWATVFSLLRRVTSF